MSFGGEVNHSLLYKQSNREQKIWKNLSKLILKGDKTNLRSLLAKYNNKLATETLKVSSNYHILDQKVNIFN